MKVSNTPGSYGLLAGLLVLLLAAYANAGCMRSVKGRSAEVAFDQTVLITATCVGPDGSGSIWHGSGVIVDNQTVITAAHVARDPDGMVCIRKVEMANDHTYVVMPGVILPDRDLATLKLLLNEFDPTYPVLYGPAPMFGDRICSMTAYPMWLYRCGEAQKAATPPGDRMHTIVVEGGNSGSGVYDMRGRLVGIITHRFSCSNGQYCGGKLATLEGYLDDLEL
jgi:S1-C subfamily serine protease